MNFNGTNFFSWRFYTTFWCISSQERDPIERVRKLILAHDIAVEKDLKVMLFVWRSCIVDFVLGLYFCSTVSCEVSMTLWVWRLTITRPRQIIIRLHWIEILLSNLFSFHALMQDIEKEVRKEVDEAIAKAKVKLSFYVLFTYSLSICFFFWSQDLLFSELLLICDPRRVPCLRILIFLQISTWKVMGQR